MQDSAFRGMDTNTYPLSNSQMNIWNLEKANQGTSINVICESIRVRGVFDITLVQQCLNLLLEQDGTLRTQVTLFGKEPVQYEVPYEQRQFPVYDFTTTKR